MTALLRFLVVVAAGVGAWFGYDAYVEARDAAEPTESDVVGAPAGAAAPWADLGLVVADQGWDGPVETSIQIDERSQTMVFDPTTGRTRMRVIVPSSGLDGVVEVDANEIYARDPGREWVVPPDDSALSPTLLRAAAHTLFAPTLADLVPEVVWPYTVILDDVAGSDVAAPTRVLTIRIKGGAFAQNAPALAAQWRNRSYLDPDLGRVEFDVELDDDGRVVRLVMVDDGNTVITQFRPLAVAPVFEAPFAD